MNIEVESLNHTGGQKNRSTSCMQKFISKYFNRKLKAHIYNILIEANLRTWFFSFVGVGACYLRKKNASAT